MLDWENCKAAFKPDGSLRDIYITQTTIEDWNSLFQLIRNFPAIEYFIDSVSKPLPTEIKEIFSTRPSANPMLRLKIGNILIVFHFFSENEIECDINPLEIKSQIDLNSLLGFIAQLGDKVGKTVLVTPENHSEHPFISYLPKTKKFLYHEIAN